MLDRNEPVQKTQKSRWRKSGKRLMSWLIFPIWFIELFFRTRKSFSDARLPCLISKPTERQTEPRQSPQIFSWRRKNLCVSRSEERRVGKECGCRWGV